MMWSKTKSQESSSKSSFHVVIKLDSFEVQRRIKYHCDARLLACEEVHRAMTVIDPDFAFRGAITAFTQEVKELYREVRQGYVPERAYLAGGVLEIEDIFRRSRALVADMQEAGGVGPGCEGWCLRMENIREAIERLEDDLEEMRTELAKELAGPQIRAPRGVWARLKQCLGGRKDLAEAKKVEAAFPRETRMRRIAPAPLDRGYYL